MRNPPWTRDELLLALDFYLSTRAHPPSNASSPGVAELSDELNRLAVGMGLHGDERFRNANGVLMKLMNFRRFDPDAPGAGLSRGSRAEEEIWARYSTRPDELAAIARAIKANIPERGEAADPAPDLDDQEAYEGELLTRAHLVRERDPRIVERKKRQALTTFGRLACECCGFDYSAKYGARGAGYIECHHTKPVSQLRKGEPTRLPDLALVCSNCHRMIHRARPWLSVGELRQAVQARAGG